RLLMKDARAPLKIVFANPVPIELGENEGVIRTGKHPNAALLWLEFLASPEGVKIIDTVDPGVALASVEGTIASKATVDFVKKGGQLAYCNAACTTEKDKMEARVAVESWGFPSVGFDPK